MPPDNTPSAPASDKSPTPAPIAAPTSIEEASRIARENIAAGRGALPDPASAPAPAADPAAPVTRHPSQDQLRADGGKFTDAKKREVGGAPVDPNLAAPGRAAAAPAGAAPEAGREPVAGDPPAAAAEGGEEEEEAVASPPAAEGEEPVTDEGEDDLTVVLPGRREGEEFPIVVDDPETAERLRQLTNGYMRGEQVRVARGELEATQAEIEAIRTEVQVDPGGFVLSELEGNPRVQQHLALFLLSQPEVWKAVANRVLSWDDPDRFRADASEIKAERYEVRETAKQEIETNRAIEQNFHQVDSTVRALLPEDFSAERAETFYTDAMRDVQAYAQRNNLMTVPPEALPVILQRRMVAYGVDPVEAAARAASVFSAGGGSNRGPVTARRTQPAPTSAAATGRQIAGAPKAPQRTGKAIIAAQARKQRAAAIPGVGAGAPNSVLTPPPGMSIEEATKWHRDNVAKRTRTTGGATT